MAGCLRRSEAARAIEQGDHLGVAQLRELAIEHPHRDKIARGMQAHHLVRLGAQPFERIFRRHRNRENDPSRLAAACGSQRGQHGRTGRNAVIHQDGGPAFAVRRPNITEVGAPTPLNLR